MSRVIKNRDISGDAIGARMLDENLNTVGIRATPEEREQFFDVVEASFYLTAKLGKYVYAAATIVTGTIGASVPLATTFGVAALGYGMLAMASAVIKHGHHQHANNMVAENLMGTKDAAAKVSFWKMMGRETFDAKAILNAMKSPSITDKNGVIRSDYKPFT